MIQQSARTTDDQGVSESIGFILIFAIIIAGIGLVTLYGYPMLYQQQVSADESIMEKNMIVLQNDIKSLAYKTVPFKETSLKISGGSLTVYRSSTSLPTLTITPHDSGGAVMLPGLVSGFRPGELRYESVKSQSDISLENGAVVLQPRNGQGGSAMLAEPRWFYDLNTNTMVINLINITSDHTMAKEGIGTVQMGLGETTYINVPGVHDINIGLLYPLESGQCKRDHAVAWDNYLRKTFDNQPGLIFNGPASPAACGTTNSYSITGSSPFTLVIKKYEVQIKNI